MRNTGLVLAALFWAMPAGAADEVVEQLDAGKAYYQEGDLSRALTELEFAVNTLRTRFSNEFMATLPEAPILWSAEKPALENGVALFGTGLMVTRRYLEQKGEGRITAELLVDSPMVQAYSAVIKSPVMIANDPMRERIRVGEWHALLKWDADRRAGDLTLSLGGRVLAKLAGRNLDDKTVLVDLMRTWDLDAVQQAAGFR